MHTFIATAKDAAGNTVTATATVTVPGAGSGSGSGSGSGDDPPAGANDDLPGCSLDAGGGAKGFATILLVLGLALLRRRRA
jgi:MYXO-CTERM domain-containing protein